MRPVIQPLAYNAMLAEVDRAVVFYTPGKEGRPKAADPPPSIVRTILGRDQWPSIPALEAVIEAPTLRDDGTIVEEPGYDAASRLLYVPDPALRLPRIPHKPSAQHVADAAALLRDELLGDFPYAGKADAANALGLLLTPVVRHIVGPAPLALLSAPSKGTGKGLHANVTARIHTGKPADVYAMAGDDAELGKAITAMLDAGSSLIFIDEVGELRSPQLAATLTAEVHTARRLGHTSMVRVPQRATWMAAGNNVHVAGDLDRRCYRIRLDPKTARPWTRTGFRHPSLETWTQDHRGELLAALLTFARAWWTADRPTAKVPTVGGFERWAQTVGGILAHAGIDGFLANITELWDESAEDADQWEAFLLAIETWAAARAFTARDLAAEITEHKGPLRDALPDDLNTRLDDHDLSKTLGLALRGRLDTRHGDDGVRVIAAGKTRSRVRLWRVVRDEVST